MSTTTPSTVTVYGTHQCPYCQMAKQLLASKGIAVEERYVDEDPDSYVEMLARSGRRTVPQIFVGEVHIGGYTDLVRESEAGRLAPLLA